MDGELIKKALCFHGKPMQKIWDDERGAGDLQVAGVPEDGNYSAYMERQKYFTFQDRAKRLKLHQFLARKANDLYDKDLGKIPAKPVKLEKDNADKNASIVVELPPYESFLNKHQDKVKRHTLESIKTGDIVYGSVTRARSGSLVPALVKPLCTDENNFKLLRDIKIKTMIQPQLGGSPLVDKTGTVTSIETNDYVRCEVVELSIDAKRMVLSLEPISDKNKNKKLGKITQEELPTLYCKMAENSSESYEEQLANSKEFDNPNYDILYTINGLNVNDNFTLMNNLKNGFPQQEYAKELRQIQASKWAFRSVAEGIEYFKVGQHVEAFQCLNKALNIDPRNVEGLVARGALYANKGSFLKAVEDFEKALKLNSFHVNARKYMGETLVALGRSYEEDNRNQDAAKAYRDCLNIIPTHEQAGMLLEAIQQRTGASVDVIPPQMSAAGTIFGHIDLDKTSSASHGTDSEDTSSDSGSDSEEEIVPNNKKEGSLSPLSKKLALHAQELEASRHLEQFHQPFYMSQNGPPIAQQPHVFPNEFKLDDDDTETRVRKLLQDASKHKKDKKKSKKSKKAKKLKKGSKSAKDLIGKNIPLDIYKYTGGGVNLNTTEETLNANLKMVEKSLQVLRKRQELLDQPTTSAAYGGRKREKSATPPPAPSFRTEKARIGIAPFQTVRFSKFAAQPHSKVSTNQMETQKFSFQIKKPVKVDKFGLVRLTTPVLKRSPTPQSPNRRIKKILPSRSRSRSHSRRRSRSRSGGRRRRWKSRSRSLSRDRYGGRRRHRSSSRSRSTSPSGSYSNRRRRDSRSLSRGRRRRSPSPLGRRRSQSPHRPYRRSRSPRFGGNRRGRGSSRGGPSTKFGNRVWKNPNSNVSPTNRKPSSSDDRWPHDKFETPSDDPTIEEIDEIISKAQRERKQNIINNDKDILKKHHKW